MDVSPINTNSAMMAISRQTETNTAMQMTMMKELADSQQQVAEMLAALGIGQNIDVQA